MNTKARRRPWLEQLAAVEDGTIVRAVFFTLLIGCAAVLYIDYSEMSAGDAAGLAHPPMPLLPPFNPAGPTTEPGPQVTTDRARLQASMSVELLDGGILELVGTIDVGAAARFAGEVEKRGSYVNVVSLSSPGGSVEDALSIGNLIREKGFATSVADGALCASSCPLILAGGVERNAGAKAAIGVHQVYGGVLPGEMEMVRQAGAAMADAQNVTARITRYLAGKGVDPALWLHALETPPEKLYYLSANELSSFTLVTNIEQ